VLASATTVYEGAPATSQYGGGTLLGFGELPPEPPSQYQVRQRQRGGNGWRYALLALAAVLLTGLVGLLAYQLVNGNQPKLVRVGNLTNQDFDAAAKALVAQGFPAPTRQDKPAELAVGRVTKMSPGPGDYPTTTVFVLTVSSGTASVTVPDVSGMSQDRARQLIEGAGLIWGKVSQQDSPDVPKDSVIGTKPPVGTSVARNQKIEIISSTGTVKVPDLKTHNLTDALAQLLKLKLVPVINKAQHDEPKDTVFNQSVPPNQEVAPGTQVSLDVSLGPPPSPTPSPPTPTDATSPPASPTPSAT
jgi:eukaryotic-like serine/threonine-protein kinase